jgi:hypothetical protein
VSELESDLYSTAVAGCVNGMFGPNQNVPSNTIAYIYLKFGPPINSGKGA